MRSEEYCENIFQAIDVIVKKHLENLPFNITLTCKIEKEIEAYKTYQVSSSSSCFIVKSNNIKYEIGDIVYVLVPNNDFSQDKIIIGKY